MQKDRDYPALKQWVIANVITSLKRYRFFRAKFSGAILTFPPATFKAGQDIVD
ncbi:hypothetical protein [Virgibacillus sp. Bac332]|uniref:hypothetical protein n=1 Tax=Virgibacillus sp. Bac332 TaxID=2419842 RepID=UPI0013CF1962|nr:hypothetical protein [Virgibacillus sp. Bac332]